MRKFKHVMRLFEAKLSHKPIAAASGISKGAVSKYVQRASEKGLGWPLPADLDGVQGGAFCFVVSSEFTSCDLPVSSGYHCWRMSPVQLVDYLFDLNPTRVCYDKLECGRTSL
jgi:hypothetical protein